MRLVGHLRDGERVMIGLPDDAADDDRIWWGIASFCAWLAGDPGIYATIVGNWPMWQGTVTA